jgi:hypothetical protein
MTTTLTRLLPGLLGLAACATASPAPTPSAPSARAALFDGRTLAGWEGAARAGVSVWTVKELPGEASTIEGSTHKGGFLLYTAGDYDHFRLTLQSRLVSPNNHLGICFWGERRADFGYGKCILVIPPDGGMWDYDINKTPPRQKVPHDPPFDPHEWHTTEIVANRATGEVKVAVNGFATTTYKDVNPARLRKGPIGLQLHGGASTVQYRNIELEVAPKDDRLLSVKPAAP